MRARSDHAGGRPASGGSGVRCVGNTPPHVDRPHRCRRRSECSGPANRHVRQTEACSRTLAATVPPGRYPTAIAAVTRPADRREVLAAPLAGSPGETRSGHSERPNSRKWGAWGTSGRATAESIVLNAVRHAPQHSITSQCQASSSHRHSSNFPTRSLERQTAHRLL